MRRDWFSCPATVAVAVAAFCGVMPDRVCAAPLLSTASVASGDSGAAKIVAQATTLPPPMTASAGGDAEAEGAVAAEAVAGDEATSVTEPDDVVSEPSVGEEGQVNGSEEHDAGLAPRLAEPLLPGDDALPTAFDLQNNPFLVQQGEQASLTGDLSGAYVPPPSPPTAAERAEAASAEMLNVLGPEVYNRRVNITTPPDTEVAEVIRLLAERAGLNFVYAEGVIRGRVTLNLRDVPLGAALQSLLASQNLVIIREGPNVMRIATRQESGGGRIETRTIYIRLNWVPAPSLVPAVTSVLQQGKVTAQPEANTLVVTDVPGNIQVIRDLVAQLDVPDKQVMIEARMVEMILDFGRGQGARTIVERRSRDGITFGDQIVARPYSIQDPVNPVNRETGEPNLVRTPDDLLLPVDQLVSELTNSAINPTLSFGGVVSILGKEFNVATTIDALESRNVANILANPRVITLNNQEAFIDIKREIPYLEVQQGVAQNQVQASVKFKEAGVSLRVLPNITNTGFVRMRLEPEQLIRSGTFLSLNGEIPIIDRRSAVTNVIVKDEDTVVLGGLREIDSNETKQQIPWLGQAPVIGWFFKNVDKRHLKNELMLFVTPHIVKAPVLSPAENYKYSRIDNHWDLPDFFFDDTVEKRENHHRFELDHDANSYYPMPLRLPPPAPALPGVPVAEGDLAGAAAQPAEDVMAGK